MRTVSPYEIISADDVLPGQLILLTIDEQTTTAFAIRDANKDVGFLILAGNHIGEVEYLDREKVQRLTQSVYMELPRDASGWAGQKRPEDPLLVAIAGEKTYFIYQKHGQTSAVDIDTGLVSDTPRNPLYLHKWAIYEDESHELLLQGGA
ncbi:hypothetical protein [Janthinobacterium sp. BJB304]|uniref:hypothetical protein n=1 Tax=Janthinobacterium sp. BJB304 TaxID=1572871 RepID=UPI00117A4055|nr:hypothetical protein [Janthinobacterium sp. BJB304]